MGGYRHKLRGQNWPACQEAPSRLWQELPCFTKYKITATSNFCDILSSLVLNKNYSPICSEAIRSVLFFYVQSLLLNVPWGTSNHSLREIGVKIYNTHQFTVYIMVYTTVKWRSICELILTIGLIFLLTGERFIQSYPYIWMPHYIISHIKAF